MQKFRFYNLISGWVVFIVAAIVYLLTIEPTSSFWDCGEFISTAYKLEVGHPPGAPFFMILGRFFTLFAGGNEMAVAYTMNVLSGLSSAFTILFLFWTITHLVRKIIGEKESYKIVDLITILGAGLVGSMAYAFSDTFWFSAAEAEVYATSSLFTAVVFWAMLKWENIADKKYANRWIILIAFLMGISIGTHLLNLLAIPALVFIFYFKKYTFSTKGLLGAIGVSLLILFVILVFVIPGIPYLASRFDLMFVNGFSLPVFSGVVFYFILLFGLTIFGIYYTRKKGIVLWNTVLLAFFVIMVGYSSYAIIVIRSVANTPLDESNPETVFSLVSYLNREQYGDRPLLHGAYFNARPISYEKGKKSYYLVDDHYEEVLKDKKYTYDAKFEGFFPRMWSGQDRHAAEYLYWAKINESDLYNVRTDQQGKPIVGRMGELQFDHANPKDIPSFGQNLRFFFRYQVGHMYFRYFMWNFAGRQNDLQGHGELTKGNWISGIKFIDEARLGPQENLPESIANSKANNKYFMLPFLLGIVGLVYQFRKKLDDASVVGLLFIMTGLAIVVYLNQYPFQPRERDYAYAGSFYAFTIWIGLGVAGLIAFLKKYVNLLFCSVGVVLLTFVFVPGLMAMENWDDHDRSDRYTARAFARNYLNSCDQNAIIFTNGDNDTFPLWYVQEVEGFRTDVRVVNLSYLTADWYIEQMGYQFYDSDALPMSLTKEQYRQGTRDYAYLIETSGALIKQKYLANKDKYEVEVSRLFEASKNLLAKSRLPVLYAKDYNSLVELGENMDPLRLYSYLNTFSNDEVAEKIEVDTEEIKVLLTDLGRLVQMIDGDYIPLNYAMAFLASDDPRFKDDRYFLPARNFILEADSATLPASVLTDGIKDHFVDEVRFRLENDVIYKNSIAQLDMIATSNWERPIYFSNTVSNDNFLNLGSSFVQEGLAYRIAPIKYSGSAVFGKVDTKRMYQRLVEEFDWGGIDDESVYLDENNIRMTIKYRYSFATLARAFVEEGNNEKAIEVLDYCMAHMPHERVPFNFSVVPVIQSYYAANDIGKAVGITEKFAAVVEGELNFIQQLVMNIPRKSQKLHDEYLQGLRDLNSLSSMAMGFGETNVSRNIQEKIDLYLPVYEQYFNN